MKKLFLIIGAPGSGKTTDAEIIANKNDAITHYSTGDMLRAEVVSKSARGKEIDSFISKGLIVPINIAIETIVDAIKNASTPIVLLDGYPRSIEQMEALEIFLQNETNISLVSVIEVSVSEQTARERVLGRARGADDDVTVFNNRMRVYLEPLTKIKKFYNDKNILNTISGEGTIEEVVEFMQHAINTKI